MRKMICALGAVGFAMLAAGSVGANAGHAPKAYVCWTATGGYTDCDWLPAGYRIPGVKRPTCCNVRGDSDRSPFVLTRRTIRALAAQGVRVDTMAPGAWAEVQAVCKKSHKH